MTIIYGFISKYCCECQHKSLIQKDEQNYKFVWQWFRDLYRNDAVDFNIDPYYKQDENT